MKLYYRFEPVHFRSSDDFTNVTKSTQDTPINTSLTNILFLKKISLKYSGVHYGNWKPSFCQLPTIYGCSPKHANSEYFSICNASSLLYHTYKYRISNQIPNKQTSLTKSNAECVCFTDTILSSLKKTHKKTHKKQELEEEKDNRPNSWSRQVKLEILPTIHCQS